MLLLQGLWFPLENVWRPVTHIFSLSILISNGTVGLEVSLTLKVVAEVVVIALDSDPIDETVSVVFPTAAASVPRADQLDVVFGMFAAIVPPTVVVAFATAAFNVPPAERVVDVVANEPESVPPVCVVVPGL
jgi:hypothetical protein